MKTTKTIAMALLVVALAGCGKETVSNSGNGQLRIFGEGFSGNSKVAFNPTNPGSGAHWVLGETIDVNGTPYEIKISNNGTDTVIRDDVDGFDNVALTALYPGDDFGVNDVEVTNTVAKREIKLNTLEISYDGQGRQKMAFPMVATAEAGATNLYFRHLTAGFQLKLKNTGADRTVATMKILAQSTAQASNLGYPEEDPVYTARWAAEGRTPSVPSGTVGANEDNYSVMYESEMNFVFADGGYTFSENEIKNICVPITITPIDRLVIKGYDAAGNELFNVIKTFGSSVPVERNVMYVIPQIEF